MYSNTPLRVVFLYKHVLHHDMGEMEDLRTIKRFKNIPTVLSRDEIRQLLAAMHGQAAIMAGLLYGAGLRINECITELMGHSSIKTTMIYTHVVNKQALSTPSPLDNL